MLLSDLVTEAQSNYVMRIHMAITAMLAWFALFLQLALTVATARANGLALGGAISIYFSFFTILTNLLVALVLTFSRWKPDSRWSRFFCRPSVTSATAVYISLVGAGYSLLLRHSWNPQGAQKLADILLHDVVPLMYVAYWLIFAQKAALRWKAILGWLIYPLGYLAYALVRGALSGRYPYPFLDAGTIGYTRVLSNAAMLLFEFLSLSIAVVAISRRVTGNSPTANTKLS